MLTVNLTKSAEALTASLAKAGITPTALDIMFDLDVSGSYTDEHDKGLTNDLLTRLIPWGLVFDPDKQLDVFTFSDEDTAHYVGKVNETNYTNYIKNNIIRKVPGYGRGTVYSEVIQKNLEHSGWLNPGRSAQAKPAGMFSRLFGGKKEEPVASPIGIAGKKTLVLFNTDGTNSDQLETQKLMQKMQDENLGVYVQFIAYDADGRTTFDNIRKLADKYNNVGITIIRDMARWVNQTDEQINNEILNPELLNWLKA